MRNIINCYITHFFIMSEQTTAYIGNQSGLCVTTGEHRLSTSAQEPMEEYIQRVVSHMLRHSDLPTYDATMLDASSRYEAIRAFRFAIETLTDTNSHRLTVNDIEVMAKIVIKLKDIKLPQRGDVIKKIEDIVNEIGTPEKVVEVSEVEL